MSRLEDIWRSLHTEGSRENLQRHGFAVDQPFMNGIGMNIMN